jgi:cytochrome P450
VSAQRQKHPRPDDGAVTRGAKERIKRSVSACHLLGGNPMAAESVGAEEEESPCGASYTAAVQKEVLRLYPTAWLIARYCLEDDQLGCYHIPRGATIFISPYAMHRNPAYWPEAERFDPGRFLGERQKQITPDMYLPFGVGARTCIGNSLWWFRNQGVKEPPLSVSEISRPRTHTSKAYL